MIIWRGKDCAQTESDLNLAIGLDTLSRPHDTVILSNRRCTASVFLSVP